MDTRAPPGATGEVVLPAECDSSRAQESGRPVGDTPEVVELAPGRYPVGSGRYAFRAPLARAHR